MAKLTNGEVERIIQMCEHYIIMEYKDTAIIKAVSESKMVEQRRVSEYLQRAHERVRQRAEPEIELERILAIGQLKYTIQKTLADQKFMSFLKARERLDQLLGLDKPTKFQHTGKDGESLNTGFAAIFVDAKKIAQQMEEELRNERNSNASI